MTETLAVFAVALPERNRLIDIFGAEAIDRALQDFGAALHDLTGYLLAQYTIVDRQWHDAEARWTTRFLVHADGLPRDAGETLAAIERAARRLAHDLLVTVFGTGTGMRTLMKLAVLPLPADVAAGATCPFAWTDLRLGELPQQAPAGSEPPPDIAGIMEKRSIQTVLQPIVRMRDRTVVGYEALSRGPRYSPFERPDYLFDAAHLAGHNVEMELLCAELALERMRGKLPADAFLAINMGPQALLQAIDRLPLDGHPKLMFELTEHLPLGGADELRDAVAELRARGIGLALDDTGCGFADMETVQVLRPEIVKLCFTIVRNAERGSPYVPAVSATVDRLLQLGCRVLAEGVETEAQHTVMSGCRIGLAQGWLYGRPAALEELR